MLDHLEKSTRVLDLRGVCFAASAYATAVALSVQVAPSGLPVLAVYVVAAGAFARRGGRRWCGPVAVHSMFAAAGGAAWASAEMWARGAIRRMLHPPEPTGMQFTIADGCFDPHPLEPLFLLTIALLVMGAGSVPVGWAARRLFPVQQEGGWPGCGGWRSLCSRRAEDRR